MDPVLFAVLEAIRDESPRVACLRPPDEIEIFFEWYPKTDFHEAAKFRLVAFIYNRPGKDSKKKVCTRKLSVA